AFTHAADGGRAGPVARVPASAPRGTGPYTYAWDFDGDGNPDDATANPVYQWAAAGTYPVTLTVTDNAAPAATHQVTKPVTINPGSGGRPIAADLRSRRYPRHHSARHS